MKAGGPHLAGSPHLRHEHNASCPRNVDRGKPGVPQVSRLSRTWDSTVVSILGFN